ncbi:SANT/Myb_domain [Hexamita inflata]|uniref:SANT/Myb domain n=1 Tax=Hexamita inflata TaxID=28002 RepID=A0AA86U1F3_9EUKA|nr:SANT/Myb domain [Hexamita inflata]
MNLYPVQSNSSKKKWTEQEIQQFFCYYELYGNDFHSYTKHIDRTHSQIKSFFHNWLRKQPPEVQQRYILGIRGGKRVPFRNSTQITSAPSEIQKELIKQELNNKDNTTITQPHNNIENQKNDSNIFIANSKETDDIPQQLINLLRNIK